MCIKWFSSALMDIATAAASSSATVTPLNLHISICVTALCDHEAVPAIPNSDVTLRRPSIYRVLDDLTSFPSTTSTNSSDPVSPGSAEKSNTSSDLESGKCKLSEIREGGGVAVCASGPQSLTREAANAVTKLQMSGRGMRLGGISLHTERFSL